VLLSSFNYLVIKAYKGKRGHIIYNMAKFKNRRMRKPRSSKAKRVARKVKSLSSDRAFRVAVQKAINKDVENKTIYTQQFNTFFNSGMTTAADCLQVVANMGNGTADFQRIGDQVRAQRLRIKGHFISRFTGSAGTTYYQNCRIGVRILVVQPKMYTDLTTIQNNATTWLPTLLKRGGTTVAFTGIVPDLYSDVNTDAITKYYDKVWYIQNPYSNAALFSGGNNLVMPDGTTRFFSKTFNLRNKLLRYDSSISAGLTSTNYNPVMLLGYVYLDGSTPDTVTTQIAISFDSYMDYQDA